VRCDEKERGGGALALRLTETTRTVFGRRVRAAGAEFGATLVVVVAVQRKEKAERVGVFC
jgi:hypothetical protein